MNDFEEPLLQLRKYERKTNQNQTWFQSDLKSFIHESCKTKKKKKKKKKLK
jgi:hypothetical protein